MTQVLRISALMTLTLAALVLTGVIDETYILFFLGLSQVPADITATTLQRAFDALSRSDWKSLGTISGMFLHSALLVYSLRSLLYVVASILTVLWAFPYLKKAFSSLRTLETDQIEDISKLSEEARRAHAIRALRTRAARKRVESYGFVTAALLSLALAIGFVTRSHGSERPETLPYDVFSTQPAMDKAGYVLRDAEIALSDTRRDVMTHENELIDIVRDELSKPKSSHTNDTEKSTQAILAALLARQSLTQLPQPPGTTEVARDYLTFGKTQLDLINHQAEIEVLQRTALVVVTKISAVILILALARILVRLYQRGLDLSVQYDGIADAVQLGKFELSGSLFELRSGLTPTSSQEDGVKVPRNVWDALQQLLKNQPKKA